MNQKFVVGAIRRMVYTRCGYEYDEGCQHAGMKAEALQPTREQLAQQHARRDCAAAKQASAVMRAGALALAGAHSSCNSMACGEALRAHRSSKRLAEAEASASTSCK